jgi:hypothetical protein
MATSTKTASVVALFDNREQTESAVQQLVNKGVSRDDISVVARGPEGSATTASATGSKGGQAQSSDATTIGQNVAGGAVFGGIGGLLIGLAALAIPGIGPVVAAGPLATTLAGAGIGAAGGGIIGAIKQSGVPDEDAQLYAEGIRRGGVLVTVDTDRNMVDQIEQILDANGAVDVDERTAQWRQKGWKGFDETAEAPAPMPRTETSSNLKTPPTQAKGVRIYSRVTDRPLEETILFHEEGVIVEPLSGRGTSGRIDDTDFRNHFRNTYGSSGADYNTYAPAYEYGSRMAADERYRGREWNTVEYDLRRDYEKSNPGSTWERMKDSVRYGWDKVTGKR